MNALMNQVNDLALPLARAAERMIQMSWQGTACIILAAIATAAWRRGPACFKYGLWCLVLVKLLLPISFSLPSGAVNVLPPPLGAPPIFEITVFEMTDARLSWSLMSWLGLAWLSGAVAVLGVYIWRFRAARALLLRSSDAADAGLLGIAAELAEKLGLRHPPRVRLTHAIAGPLVIGPLRPVIYIPEDLFARLDPDERAMLLAHELAHVKRRDTLVAAIEMVALAVHWFNPLAWWMMRAVRTQRELACDDRVVALFNDRADDYGSGLIKVARFQQALGRSAFGMAALGEGGGSFAARVKNILNRRRRPIAFLSIPALLTLAAAAAVVLPSHSNKTVQTSSALIVQNPQSSNAFDTRVYKIDRADISKIKQIVAAFGLGESLKDSGRVFFPKDELIVRATPETMVKVEDALLTAQVIKKAARDRVETIETIGPSRTDAVSNEPTVECDFVLKPDQNFMAEVNRAVLAERDRNPDRRILISSLKADGTVSIVATPDALDRITRTLMDKGILVRAGDRHGVPSRPGLDKALKTIKPDAASLERAHQQRAQVIAQQSGLQVEFMHGDQIAFRQNGSALLTGNVEIQTPDVTYKADSAEVFPHEKKLVLAGNAEVAQIDSEKKTIWKADVITGNFQTGKMLLYMKGKHPTLHTEYFNAQRPSSGDPQTSQAISESARMADLVKDMKRLKLEMEKINKQMEELKRSGDVNGPKFQEFKVGMSEQRKRLGAMEARVAAEARKRAEQLSQMEDELDLLRQTLDDNHPKVVDVKRRIDVLKNEMGLNPASFTKITGAGILRSVDRTFITGPLRIETADYIFTAETSAEIRNEEKIMFLRGNAVATPKKPGAKMIKADVIRVSFKDPENISVSEYLG